MTWNVKRVRSSEVQRVFDLIYNFYIFKCDGRKQGMVVNKFEVVNNMDD